MIRVSDGVYQLQSCGFVNAYLIVGGQDLTLVDSGHSRCPERLEAELRDNGFLPRDVARVVLTHAHPAHVGGVAHLLKNHPVRVFAHPKELPVLRGKAPRPRRRGLAGLVAGAVFEEYYPWEPIDSVQPVEPGTPLRGIPQWQVLHTPGHTDGSLSLFHPARQILICGDVLSNRGGRLHAPAGYRNADKASLRSTLETLGKLDCDILCCGHGPVVRGGAFRFIEKVLAGL